MPVDNDDRFGNVPGLRANSFTKHREAWKDLTENDDVTGSLCVTCLEDGVMCDGCGDCQGCCNCTPSDCDCDACEERRANG